MNTRSSTLKISITVALTLSLSIGLAGDAAAGLRGRVLRPDGQPASGATVYHYRYCHRQFSKVGVRSAEQTDAGGLFQFTRGLPQPTSQASDYLVAIAPGYGLACWSLLPEDDEATGLALKLTEEITAEGTVTDVFGKPVPGALVTVTSASYGRAFPGWRTHLSVGSRNPVPELIARTDAAGRFSISHLPAAPGRSLSLHVRHKSYAVAGEHIFRDGCVSAINIVLYSGGAVTGRVTHGSTGKAAAGIPVCANFEFGITGADGRYRISNLRASSYRLKCSIGTDEEWTARPQKGIDVAPGETRTSVDFALIRGGVVSGKVVEALTGSPLPEVSVCARDGAIHFDGKTGADGGFRVRVPPGAYSVYARSSRSHYCPSGSKAITVTVADGQESAPLRFELARSLAVTGRALGPGGQPVPEAEVRATGRNCHSYARSDRAGRFRLEGIVPDSSLTIYTVQPGDKVGSFVRLDVGSHPIDGLEVRLVPLVTIAGRVVDREGAPVKGVCVALTASGQTTGMEYAASGEDGRYEFFAVPGIDYSPRTQIWTPQAPVVSAVAGKRHQFKDITVTRRRISGRALDSTGKPVPRARIEMFAPYGGDNLTTVTDGQGTFRFHMTAIGELGFLLSGRGRNGTTVGRAQFRLADADREVVLRFVRSARVVGRVVDEDGKPIPSARAGLWLAVNKGSVLGPASVQSDVNGRFAFTEVVSQTDAHVWATAEGYGPQRVKPVFLLEGQTLDVGDLCLPTADSFIAGRVIDQDGRPLPGVRISCDGKRIGHKETQTGPQGRYRIEGLLEKDRLRVTASSSKYGSKSRNRVTPGSNAVDFVIRTEKREPWAWLTRLFGGKEG